jgi:DNA polymerase III sliding clamp (beta) subunit (PCNA family)
MTDEHVTFKLRHIQEQLKLISEHFAYYAKMAPTNERRYALGLASEKLNEALEMVYTDDAS